MRRLRWLVCLFAFISLGGFSADAQTGAAQAQAPASAKGPALKVAAREKGASSLPSPEGFQNFVVAGKLTLSLDDAIRLALENNTAPGASGNSAACAIAIFPRHAAASSTRAVARANLG